MREGRLGMRKIRMGLVATMLALASIVVAAPPASACAEGQPCYWINVVCQTALGRPCIR
jgi:hypothetical protein